MFVSCLYLKSAATARGTSSSVDVMKKEYTSVSKLLEKYVSNFCCLLFLTTNYILIIYKLFEIVLIMKS